MNKKLVFAVILGLAVLTGGTLAYTLVLRPIPPPSAPISAVPLEPLKAEAPAAAPAAPAAQADSKPLVNSQAGENAAPAKPEPAPQVIAQAAPAQPPANPPAGAPRGGQPGAGPGGAPGGGPGGRGPGGGGRGGQPAPTPSADAPPIPPLAVQGGEKIYSISQEKSNAQFSIAEVLRGTPTNAVGKTNQVAGQIAVNLADLSKSRVGQIRVNARTLVTDNPQRNGAINNMILNTRKSEFITFQPKEVIGLKGPGKVGETYNFKIAGDLTIKDVTKPATFDATLKIASDNEISGKVTTTVKRADYGITIPNLPFIANVGEDVKVEVDGVALVASAAPAAAK